MDQNHPEVKFGKTGVLLVNLGTPDSTSWWDVRKYLKEFLSDRRVIEVNPVIWQIILNLFILTFRPSKSAHAYKKIWFKETNESPLLYFTKSQADKLNKKIGNKNIIVDFAMRYGNPSIKSKLIFLKEQGCENIIVLPLYPQYAAATTATVCDEIYRSLMQMRWQPSLQVIPHYESNNFYIEALINSIERKTQSISWKPDLIISSFHGIPKSYFDKGDPYHCYCHKTTRLMKEKYSKTLPDKGIKNLLVICPGFASDCVETLEEIDIQGREIFLGSGGKNFDLIPCLNDNSDHIDLFEKLVSKYI